MVFENTFAGFHTAAYSKLTGLDGGGDRQAALGCLSRAKDVRRRLGSCFGGGNLVFLNSVYGHLSYFAGAIYILAIEKNKERTRGS